MIKFDLHIHSIESNYKDDNGIVNNSTIENIDTLLTKLEENQIVLFSITDHNRFNFELYKEIDKKLSDPKKNYKYIKNILSGVEFDVQLDENMKKCHIITIFDSKNNIENYKKINTEINNALLKDKNEFYTKKQFEELLYNIGLNTILIACQRKDIHNHTGQHNSLSDSLNQVEKIISVGYINALEYQKPKVEGILRNNLIELPSPIGLVTGSDCHTWNFYPYHDKNIKNLDFYHSKAKILPTFKGLLMAITSPETRFNCRENNNPSYIKEINTKNKTIVLKNGINAIIGENGSGKSTLLKFINKEIKETYEKDIIEKNQFKLNDNIYHEKIRYIKQGDIINKFNNNTLFSSNTESNFKELDHTQFKEKYNLFAKNLKKIIEKKIQQKEIIDSLISIKIKYTPELNVKNYFIHIVYQKGFDDISNKHEEHLNNIKNIIISLNNFKSYNYFNKYNDNINNAITSLIIIYQQIKTEWKILNLEAKIKNIIQSSITEYNLKINSSSSAIDKEKKEYKDKKQNIVDTVIKAIILSNSSLPKVIEPEKVNGVSKNTKQGFCFNREANYNNASMLNSFLSYMFTKEFSKLSTILNIDNYSDFIKGVKYCANQNDITIKWEDNLNKFLNNSIQVKEYITDSSDKQIGNTLGEMSLSFFKYYTQDCEDWNILIMDQPEDNISNNNISKHLINYFNSIRDTKQLILVTHNPLLVVNLDVDNVIYLKNNGGELSFNYGCLEYEDESVNILDLIAKSMDEGKESIEKRLKVYGK